MNNHNLIQRNNQLRENLNSENKCYYEKLLIYIRCKSILYRQKDVEQLLLDILYDLIDAQNYGQSAECYFGRDPKSLSNEILQKLPKSFFDAFKLACYIVFGYIIFFTIPNIVMPSYKLDLGNLIIFGTLGFILSIITLWLIGKEIYQENKLKKYAYYTLSIMIFVAIIISSVFFNSPFSFSLPGLWGIITILILFVITTTIFIIEHKRMPFLINIYILIVFDGVLGICSRIPNINNLITQPISKSTVLWIIAIGGSVVAIICGFSTYWYIMRDED